MKTRAKSLRILVVDDDPIAAETLSHAMSQFGYASVIATDGVDALKHVRTGQFGIVISDIEMPRMNGIDLCREIRQRNACGYTYVILLTGRSDTDSIVEGLDAGADDYIAKPFHPVELQMRIRAGQRLLMQQSRELMIFAMAKLADSRDNETGSHLERIREYCRLLCEELSTWPQYQEIIDGIYIRSIYETSPLHDIGKVAIPDRVLLKPGRLTPEEFAIMTQHAQIGGDTLRAVADEYPEAVFLRMAYEIAMSHHERWDGTGYPRGLAGENIPLSVRIVAVADVYDALTSQRVYKPAYSHDKAVQIIRDSSGSHFDPALVKAFLKLQSQFRDIKRSLNDDEITAPNPLIPTTLPQHWCKQKFDSDPSHRHEPRTSINRFGGSGVNTAMQAATDLPHLLVEPPWKASTVLNAPIKLCFCLWVLSGCSGSGLGSAISNALGAREAGRGGTNLAFSDNGVVLLDNPAGMQGLVGQCECQDSYVDLGFAGLFTDLSYADADNPTTDAADNPSGLGHFMVARRVHEDVVLGFGAFTPAGFGSDYDLQGPASLPGQHTYKSIGALLRILPGFSAQLTDRLSVGGTLGLAVSHVELEGPYYVNSAPLTGTPTLLDLQTTATALSWSCGLQYALTDQTTIAARYQSENRFRSSGKSSLAIAPLGFSYYDVDVALTWASSGPGLGLVHKIDASQRVAIDFEWEFWSHAFDEVGLTFTNPSNPIFLAAAGPRVSEQFPLRWEDSLIVSFGYEKDLSPDRTVRVGYRFQDNPVPRQTTSTYLQTTLEHHFSVGCGFQHCGWDIDAAYQFAFAPEVSTGTSAYPGGDFSNATVRTQTHMLFWGAMRRF